MTPAEQKAIALKFLKSLETGNIDPNILADNLEWETMGRLPGVAPVRGKETFLQNMPRTLKAIFPNGLNMKFHTVISEGPHVAVQCESDTTAANGRHYANRYHFYVRFDGGKIAQVREYCDTDHVRQALMS
jgi:ketosteroid isomerase-like protein